MSSQWRPHNGPRQIARAFACALNLRGKPFDSRTSNWSQTNIGMHIRKNPPNCLDRDFHHPVCDQWSMAIKTPPTFNCSGTICGVAWTRCWLNTGVVYCIWSYELFDHVKCIKQIQKISPFKKNSYISPHIPWRYQSYIPLYPILKYHVRRFRPHLPTSNPKKIQQV